MLIVIVSITILAAETNASKLSILSSFRITVKIKTITKPYEFRGKKPTYFIPILYNYIIKYMGKCFQYPLCTDHLHVLF